MMRIFYHTGFLNLLFKKLTLHSKRVILFNKERCSVNVIPELKTNPLRQNTPKIQRKKLPFESELCASLVYSQVVGTQ